MALRVERWLLVCWCAADAAIGLCDLSGSWRGPKHTYDLLHSTATGEVSLSGRGCPVGMRVRTHCGWVPISARVETKAGTLQPRQELLLGVLSKSNPILRGKVDHNCSAISFAHKVAWRRQDDTAQKGSAAVFVGKPVAGAAEMHGRMQQDAATGSFFSKGFTFRLPHSTQSVIIDVGLYDEILHPAPGQHVIAIEASLREAVHFNLLSKCEALQNCTLIMAAVGDGSDRLVDLWESHRPFGSATITSSDPRQWPMDRGFAVVPMIPFKTILDAVPAHLPIALCKIDTNGNDVLVLRSAGEALRRCEKVRMEIVSEGQGGPLHQHRAALSLFRSLEFARYARGDEVWKGQYDLTVWKHAGPEGMPLQTRTRASRRSSWWGALG